MKAVRILLSAGILTAIAGTTFAADERIVTDEGVATFSFFKPASVRAEVGTTGYGGAISYNANPHVGVTLGYNGGDISWSDDVEVDDVNYDVDMDNNLVYLNAEIRPWANWFYVAAGVGYIDQQYGLLARNDGGTIKVNGEDTNLTSLGYDLDYSNDIAPYLGIGFSPAITNRWGVFGEVGAYYVGNPTVTNVNYYGGTPRDAALVEEHINEVRNDDKFEWLPVAKLGVSFRF
ncbi:ornithine uptake porin CarO [Acinetobacter junii]|uniref:ornithine uptake porin CarO n=1 Tax=Acinetobacter junii TaxID=40215 RepID=UPI000F68255F|nr:ornithine uptake porin CarO [Acinetobacter junii]QXR11623.1 ornithine uptake porin CarO [Acinetobacter junii]